MRSGDFKTQTRGARSQNPRSQEDDENEDDLKIEIEIAVPE